MYAAVASGSGYDDGAPRQTSRRRVEEVRNMGRPVVVTVLACAAIVLGLSALASMWGRPSFSYSLASRMMMLQVYLDEGSVVTGVWTRLAEDKPYASWQPVHKYAAGLMYSDEVMRRRYRGVNGSMRLRQFAFPGWLPALALVAYPAWVIGVDARRRRHRLRQGLCLHCGYDTKGNTGAVCPECGRPARAL